MKKNEAQLELLFKALADRTRLRLLNLLAAGEVSVCACPSDFKEPRDPPRFRLNGRQKT